MHSMDMSLCAADLEDGEGGDRVGGGEERAEHHRVEEAGGEGYKYIYTYE